MSGIYQLNQATGSATSPSSGSTFIGTNHTNQLFTKNSSGTVTVYGTGGGSTIDTGSFATTGSNNFTGSQFINGNLQVTASGYIIGSQIRNAEGNTITIADNLTVDSPTLTCVNISSSGTITAPQYNINNQASLLTAADRLTIASEDGGALGQLFTKTTEVTIGGSTTYGAFLSTEGNIYVGSDITASGNISASGHISAFGSSSFHGLPLSEPTTTGSLWLSGSSVVHPNSGYLMVFNP